MRERESKEVFANQYYYKGSHGMMSPLSSSRIFSSPSSSSVHLFNLPSSNKQIGSQQQEREIILLVDFLFLLFLDHVRSCLSLLLALSCARRETHTHAHIHSSFLFRLLLLPFLLLYYYKREPTSDLLLLLFDMHFYKQSKNTHTHTSLYF
jgi:hypothetical protein